MFRYIGVSWNAARESEVQHATQLMTALRASGWCEAFLSAGLSVFVVGRVARINDFYRLPADGGVILGRLFRRHSDAFSPRDLELTEQEGVQIARTSGQFLIDQFWGRWIAFLQSSTGDHWVLRDPTGTLPCYRVETDGVSITFSWLEDLSGLSGLESPEVSWDAVAGILVLGRLGASETALRGVRQVLPGELTTLTTAGIEPRALWRAVDVARRPIDPQPSTAERLLRDATTESVRGWMSAYDRLVLRLSGGLDSAITLGSLYAGDPPADIVCLNYHSPGSDSDERSYARLAASRAGVRLTERLRDDSFSLTEVVHPALTPVPGSHIGRMGSDRMDAEVAEEHGAAAIFTGAGGDQLFNETRSAWPAADYLQLRGVDQGFLGAVMDAARLGRLSFWQALVLAFRCRFTSRDPLAGVGRYVMLTPRDVVRTAVQQSARFVHPGLLEGADLPMGKLLQLRSLVCPFDYYNPFAPHTSPELVHPLMSQPLLELSLSLPTYHLTRGGRARGLARQAFADRIPSEIAARRSKGGTEAHITSALQRSLPMVRSLLLDGELVRRGMLDRHRVEAALGGRTSTKDAYVTELHTCIAIEAWLRRVHGEPPRAAF